MIPLIPDNLKVALVMGGEKTNNRTRSNRALEIHRAYKSLPLILTGSHSGIYGRELPKHMIKESHQMYHYLRSHGIPDSDLRVEDQSLDTLGNFYFSHPLLTRDPGRTGVIIDEFQMARALWCGRKVEGPNRELVGIIASPGVPLKDRLIERTILHALKHDLNGIQDGHYELIEHYMQTKHPMYAKDTECIPPSKYGKLIEIAEGLRDSWLFKFISRSTSASAK